MKSTNFIAKICICMLLIALTGNLLYGNDMNIRPKEPGVYIKTDKSLIRLMPNILSDEQGVLYIESNKPSRFFLKNIESFVVFGKYDIDVLTINPLIFLNVSPLGQPRFVFGKAVDIDIKNKGNDQYIIKPKTLMGRGYYCIWIENTVWDFIID